MTKQLSLILKTRFTFINRAYLKRDLLHDKDGACKDFNKAEELGFLNISAATTKKIVIEKYYRQHMH